MSPVTEAVDLLVRSGINLVAVDFDQTLISMHTGGKWQGGPEELHNSVRDVFRELFPALVEKDVSLAIVTFSGQTDLIRQVLRLSFPDFGDNIVVKARDNSWGHPGIMHIDGKQRNMQSAASDCSQMTGKIITRNTTLLIDDDPNNIQIALNNAVRAVFFDPKHPNRLIDDLQEIGSLQIPEVSYLGFQPPKLD